MDFNELVEFLFSELKPRLENNQGLSVFANERAKFEGWLKVELVDILFKKLMHPKPEYPIGRSKIDIFFESWAMEIKTTNTNYQLDGVKSKTRPITQNVKEILKDIKKLKGSSFKNKIVCFIVYPLQLENNTFWQKHLVKIINQLISIRNVDFRFNNNVAGKIYLGLI